jgi:DNA-binding NarL/FixJ family response regulator
MDDIAHRFHDTQSLQSKTEYTGLVEDMTDKARISVFIIDDHRLVRAGVAALLRNENDMNVVGEADCNQGAMEMVRRLNPDIVLMDISVPMVVGMELLYRITHERPSTGVIVLTQSDNEQYIKHVMQSGPKGYLLKSAMVDELIRAIRAVSRGEQFFTPSVSKVMIESFLKRAADQVSESSVDELTQREVEILRMVAEGYTNQQIGVKLSISARTAEFHRANINRKLNIHDTAGLVKYAIQKKIINIGV